MSIKLMTQVWDAADVSGSELLVLLALADFANDDGTSIYPSMKTIAAKARLSPDQARRVVHKLIEKGIVTLEEEGGWTGKRNKSNEYSINVEAIGVLANCKDGTSANASRGTRAHASTVLAPMQDDPSLEPPYDPPTKKAAAEPPAFLPDTDADKDGRFTIQLVRDTNLFGHFQADSRARAAVLEESYSMDAIRKAVAVLVERHKAMIDKTGRGIQDTIAFLAKVLAEDFKQKPPSKAKEKFLYTDPVTKVTREVWM